MSKTSLKAALAICMIAIVAAAVYAAVINRVTVNNTVTVTIGIGVYKDDQCTQPLTTIAWGDVPRGGMKTFIIYVRAESGSAGINAFWDTTTLPMNFTLSAALNGYDWNKNVALVVPANTVYGGFFTLNVASDAEAKAYNWITEFRAETV